MRISSIIKFVEDRAISVGGSLYAAGSQFAHDVSVEAKARAMYAEATKGEKAAALKELRSIVEAADALIDRRARDEIVRENEALKAQLAKAKRAAARAKAR